MIRMSQGRKQEQKQERMDSTITIKMTAKEKTAVMRFTEAHNINLSGLVRTLLFNYMGSQGIDTRAKV